MFFLTETLCDPNAQHVQLQKASIDTMAHES